MKSTISLVVDSKEVDVEVGIFPAGEVHVKVGKPWILNHSKLTVIRVILRCAEGIQALAQLKAIVDYYHNTDTPTNLYLGYAAYSRQDRICSDGEALAAKVFANQINAMNFTNVITVDNHSGVITALINNVLNLPKSEIFSNVEPFFEKYDVFVAPDFGAAKEVQDLAIKYGKQFVQGTKNRDPATGNLSGFGHYCPEGDLDGKRVLIIDDICDGGGTFLGLADSLRDNHVPSELSLYVTHGIFSKGIDCLTSTFDTVYTTDTLIDNDSDIRNSVQVINLK